MEEKPLISVIVPAYNTKKYLRRCVDSILKQTYSPIEIILVDDGSTDGSGKICDEYGKKYANVMVIHKKNGGAASARNRALGVAKGEYIGFVDGDDYIDRCMYEKMYHAGVKYDAEMITCDAYWVFERNRKEKIGYVKSEKVYKGKNIADYIFARNIMIGNKMIKNEILQNVRFREGKKAEDALLMLDIMQNIKSLVGVAYPGYYYVQYNENSVTKLKLSDSDIDLVDACKEILTYPEYRVAAYRRYNIYFQHYKDKIRILTWKDFLNSQKIINDIRNEYQKVEDLLLKDKQNSIKNEKEILLFIKSPLLFWLYCKVEKLGFF